jgi:hypothetical protein
MALATIGKDGRNLFSAALIDMIGDASTPRPLKVAWNNAIDALTA